MVSMLPTAAGRIHRPLTRNRIDAALLMGRLGYELTDSNGRVCHMVRPIQRKRA